MPAAITPTEEGLGVGEAQEAPRVHPRRAPLQPPLQPSPQLVSLSLTE